MKVVDNQRVRVDNTFAILAAFHSKYFRVKILKTQRVVNKLESLLMRCPRTTELANFLVQVTINVENLSILHDQQNKNDNDDELL